MPTSVPHFRAGIVISVIKEFLMRSTRLAVGVFAAVATMSGLAAAQETGFALNRFDPSDRGSDWFSTDSLDLRGSNRLGVGVVGDWSHKPLVWYDANGDEMENGRVVRNQVYAHFGAS